MHLLAAPLLETAMTAVRDSAFARQPKASLCSVMISPVTDIGFVRELASKFPWTNL
jgi:hypothetical protein